MTTAAEQPAEVVEFKIDGDFHSFRAGVVEHEDGKIDIAPVPESIGVETWNAVIAVRAKTISDGLYIWESNTLTNPPDGQIVTLSPTRGGVGDV